jgi:hypothetical protein
MRQHVVDAVVEAEMRLGSGALVAGLRGADTTRCGGQ